MDYSRTDLADRLASQYVAGTLRGAARRRFEGLLPAHPALRDAKRAWEDRLMPLTLAIAPVQPSGNVWRRISERIGNGDAKAAAPGLWHRLSFWRGFASLASVATIALAVLLANPRPTAPPVVVVLAATAAATGNVPPTSIVASISGDGSSLVTRAIAPVALRPDRSLELWAVPTAGAPRSLGLLPGGSGTVALRGKVLAGADTLAVTVEPAGGSPTGKPTGPIVYAGKFTL
ncbi:MAG TPA: anti-sigma factor [Caldimonas sp.]|nr:anti-sigma factor [Caldimonas sp.]